MPRGLSTVNPTKRKRVWKLHPAKRAGGQRKCVYWKSVFGVYKFLRMLIDAPLITLFLTFQSVICTTTLWSIWSSPAKDRTTIPSTALDLIQILKVSLARIETIAFWWPSSSLNHYTMRISYYRLNLTISTTENKLLPFKNVILHVFYTQSNKKI
jgi:hypothetical protein